MASSKLDFSALKGKGKQLSKRDINFVLAAAAFLILIAAYMLGYQSLKESTESKQAKLEEETAYLTQLQEYQANLSKYESEIKGASEEIALSIKRLPVGFKNEDFLLCMMKADEEIGSNMSSISYNGVDHISDFATYVGADGYKNVQGYRTTASASLTMTYEQFKNYLDYIYDPDHDYTFLDSVSLSYNSENEMLSTVFNISKFYIEYEGGVYQGEPGYDVRLGTENPFASK